MKVLQFVQGLTPVPTAGTPVKLVASSTIVDSVEFYARKNPTTANTGNIYVGFSAIGGQNYRVLAPEGDWSMASGPDYEIDLSLIYIDAATNADALVYSAFKSANQ